MIQTIAKKTGQQLSLSGKAEDRRQKAFMDYLQQYFIQIARHTLHEWVYWSGHKTKYMGCVADCKKWLEQYQKMRCLSEVASAKWLIDYHFCILNQQTPSPDLQNLQIYIEKQSSDFVKASIKTALPLVDWSAIAAQLRKYA